MGAGDGSRITDTSHVFLEIGGEPNGQIDH
jgi:hypothetical protein